MRTSLFVKLLVAFAVVVLVGTGLMTFLANRAASGGLTLFVDQSAQRRAQLVAPLLAWYHGVTGSWVGIDEFLQQPAPIPPNVRRRAGLGPTVPVRWAGSWILNERFLLIGQDGYVVFDSQMDTEGEAASEELLASAMPIGIGEQRMGWLLFAQPVGNTLESSFFDRVNRWLLWSGLGTGALALLLALFLARQITAPVRRLTRAAMEMSVGDLKQRVEVSNRDEVGDLARAFNLMAARLEFTELQRRTMVADIAHELRNPLTVMQGKLEGMMDGVLPLDQDQVGTVYDHTLLLSRLVDDLRLLSLAQAGQLPLERSDVDMGALVSGVVEDFRPLAQDEGVSVDTQLNAEQLEANVDPHRMSQVLSNLLSNAVRHAGQGSVVTIGVGRYGAAVEVSVSDTGPGIDPEDLPHVFERFYRVDRSRSRSEGGSGLGLAIAKEVVEAHGGRIWAESNQGEGGGEGAVFTFRVPLRPDGSEPLPPDASSLDEATRRTLAM